MPLAEAAVEKEYALYSRFFFVLREKRYMIRHRQVTGMYCLACLLGILMLISLASCAFWTSPTPPSTAFDDAATACQVEAMQADLLSGVFESNQYDAYIACLHDKGW